LDYVQNDYFTEKTIAKEKGIIIEEVRRDKNDINGRIYLEGKKALFIKNKKDRMIVGEEEDVRGITLDEVKLIHKVFYNPSNMFLVVTGNFKVKDVIETVRSNQNNKRFEKYDVKKIHHKEPLEVEKSLVEIVDDRVDIPKAIISYKIDREKYKDIEDIELNYYLSLILKCNFSASSLLYEELKEKNMISIMHSSADIDGNIIVISIYIISDKVREVINIVKNKIKNMTMNESDFVRNRRASIANLIYGYDDMEYTTSRIIKQLISYGKIYDNLYDIYNGININKANEIMNKLDFDNESIVILEKQ
jgi:predicted Zn-dependent peptidase